MSKKINIIYKIVPKSIKKTQAFWNIAKQIGKLIPLGVFKKLPNELIIEPGNPCNLRCPVCPTHFAMKRKRGFMRFDLFKSIIDEFKPIKKKPLINMNFSGEPLLNKDIVKFIEYAYKNGHKTFVSTNCTVLTPEFSKALIQSGLTSIHLCMDGFTKEAQEAYRVGSKFEEVKKNIEEFTKIKKQLKSKTPEISIQTLLTSFSETQMNEIEKWSKKIGVDEINFKSLSMGSYTTPEIKKKYSYLLPKNKKLRRKTSRTYKTVCVSVLEQGLIYWNGDLGLCCIDFDNKLKLDNIKEKGFIKTWQSNSFAQKRKLGFLKKYNICKNCSIGNADSVGYNIKIK